MKQKKLFALLLCACMGTSMMSGCANDSKKAQEQTTSANSAKETTKAATAPSDVKLRMAWWGSQKRHDATIKVNEMYAKANGITIENEFYDSAGYWTKVNILVSANDLWDCWQVGNNWAAYMANIVPLNDYIKSGVIDTSKTTDAFLATTQNDKGVQLGISLGTNTRCLAYNPSLFQQAGVEEPNENWTWEDYSNASIKIHEKLGIFGSSVLEDFMAGCVTYIPQHGSQYNFFKKDSSGIGFEDYTMLKDFMQLRVDLVKAGAFPDPGEAAEVTTIEGDYIAKGKAAMTWVNSNQFVALTAVAKDQKLKLCALPKLTADGPSGMAVKSSQMLSIAANSKYPEEVAKLISYYVNDEEANKVLNGERGVPIMSNIREMLSASATDEQKMIFEMVDWVGNLKDSKDVSLAEPKSQAEIVDAYSLYLEKAIYDELTVDEAAKQFYQEALNIFDRSK